MSAHAFKFAALTAALLALPFGIATAQEAEAAPPTGQTCGGFAGLACPEGETCVDDRGDDCNPKSGGADCPGVCATGGGGGSSSRESPKVKNHCNYGDPDMQYASKDPEECIAITFICEDGYEGFFNDCGCGCQPIAQ